MKLESIDSLLQSRSYRTIFESVDLAQLGDFLVNFIYSSVRIGMKSTSGGIHVWDSSLRTAMELAKLRSKLGKNAKPDRVADAAEAFVAFCYFNEVMSLDDMTEFLSRRLNQEDFTIPQIEKDACATAFGELLQRLAYLASKKLSLT